LTGLVGWFLVAGLGGLVAPFPVGNRHVCANLTQAVVHKVPPRLADQQQLDSLLREISRIGFALFFTKIGNQKQFTRFVEPGRN
jgi:hypothetical protein